MDTGDTARKTVSLMQGEIQSRIQIYRQNLSQKDNKKNPVKFLRLDSPG